MGDKPMDPAEKAEEQIRDEAFRVGHNRVDSAAIIRAAYAGQDVEIRRLRKVLERIYLAPSEARKIAYAALESVDGSQAKRTKAPDGE